MKHLLSAGVSLAILIAAAAAFAAEGAPIRSVILSSGGLAEIHRSIPLAGSGEIGIEVPLDQVDDVLKSLVIRDPSGTVSSLRLDGTEPVEETFRRLPFSPDELASVPALLSRLQGTEVTIQSGGNTVTGRVLGVFERETARNGASFREPTASLMLEDGSIRMIALGPNAWLGIQDPDLRGRIAEAAATAGRASSDSMRRILISIEGEGSREVGLSYVAPAPVWKTAWRMLTGNDEGVRLQGWAILENATGDDWEEISLTLASGAPVTLSQRLHRRYWHERQELPVMADVTTLPDANRHGRKAFTAREGQMLAMPAAPAVSMAREAAMDSAVGAEGMASISAPTLTAEAREGEITASFTAPFRISLAAGESLSFPFLDRTVKGERISLYRPGMEHPAASLRIENDTGSSLPGGILTIHDQQEGYLGDAALEPLPAGQSRILSFAADRKVRVSADHRPSEIVTEASIANGILRASVMERISLQYRLEGAADAGRTVLIEEPRRQGWQLTTDLPVEETAEGWRIRVEIPRGGKRDVSAIHQIRRTEEFAILHASEDSLLYWSGRISDPETRGRLDEVAARKRTISRAELDLARIGEEISRIEQRQARMRDNLGVVPEGSAMAQRYLDALGADEDRIAAAEKQREGAEADIRRMKAGLADFVASL